MPAVHHIPDISKHLFVRILTARKFAWLRHGLFLTVSIAFAYLGETGDASDLFKNNQGAVRSLFLFDTSLLVFILLICYANIYVLIPRLLFRSKFVLYSLCFITMVVMIYLAAFQLDETFLRPYFPDNTHIHHRELSWKAFVENSLVVAVLLGCVTGLKVFTKWIKDITRMNQLQQINLRTELEQLKSQINPHFLFNTLNNLVVLTKVDPDKAGQVLLGLSDLLRYQLYDSTLDAIQLTKDIAFINNLLALEKIRKDDFDYEVTTAGKIEGITLPPFLFIPFIENAIKHGASSVGHSYLTVNFTVEGEKLIFIAENSKPPIKKQLPGGLGLNNIRRRLELLYPNKHLLEIKDGAHNYLVTLTIAI